MIEYTQDAGLTAQVQAIIDSGHPALKAIKDQELKIVPVMKVRTNNEGEHEQNPGPPARIQKVSDLWKLFTDAHYLLIVDYYFFNHAGCVEAVLFNALCGVEVKVTDGSIKLATKEPEIKLFAATIQKYGAFDEILLGLREWMNEAKTKAAKSFAAKVATGSLGEEPQEPAEEEDPPRVHAGVPEEDEQPRRGGRNRR